jgi:hypothetical protein
MKATFVVNDNFLKNKIFNELYKKKDDYSLYPYRYLKKAFFKLGIDLSTQDINPIEKSRFVIYNDFTKKNLFNLHKNNNNFLLIQESFIINKFNWNPILHKFFRRIFTWDDDLVKKSDRYVKVFIPIKKPNKIIYKRYKKKDFVFIYSNKMSNSKNELYSYRKSILDWFLIYHPYEIDLYGRNWNDNLNKPLYPFYKGEVRSKISIIQDYKFNFSIENESGKKGYITEKIFHSLFSGTIPLYKGNEFIKNYIPSNCYIDLSTFNNLNDMYAYTKNLSKYDYNNYINNIKKFVNGGDFNKFTDLFFSDTIINNILDAIK